MQPNHRCNLVRSKHAPILSFRHWARSGRCIHNLQVYLLSFHRGSIPGVHQGISFSGRLTKIRPHDLSRAVLGQVDGFE
jgi:hypothetical protein